VDMPTHNKWVSKQSCDYGC